ncbi:MAG: hypothetical protein PHQ66_03730 [Candidatus Nanoarchaeia archaeon]|nr:hypothetical protein [Candidatus Nanoarchaeia archaeon]MDD5357528.1 hypothetical protein [Candidatus Nanoarchaeia archaeon]MDD5588447.1 hypothetical protein [Candidatus Nanoarchaeia archaeon]
MTIIQIDKSKAVNMKQNENRIFEEIEIKDISLPKKVSQNKSVENRCKNKNCPIYARNERFCIPPCNEDILFSDIHFIPKDEKYNFMNDDGKIMYNLNEHLEDKLKDSYRI